MKEERREVWFGCGIEGLTRGLSLGCLRDVTVICLRKFTLRRFASFDGGLLVDWHCIISVQLMEMFGFTCRYQEEL